MTDESIASRELVIALVILVEVAGEYLPFTDLFFIQVFVPAAYLGQYGTFLLLGRCGHMAMLGTDGKYGTILGTACCNFLRSSGEVVESY